MRPNPRYEAALEKGAKEAEEQRRTVERLRFRVDAMTTHARKHGLELGLDESWVVPDLAQVTVHPSGDSPPFW